MASILLHMPSLESAIVGVGSCLMSKITYIKYFWYRNFLVSPVVKTSPSRVRGGSLIPDPGANIPYTSCSKNQNIKQKQYCNKFNRDFFKCPPQKKNLKK